MIPKPTVSMVNGLLNRMSKAVQGLYLQSNTLLNDMNTCLQNPNEEMVFDLEDRELYAIQNLVNLKAIKPFIKVYIFTRLHGFLGIQQHAHEK